MAEENAKTQLVNRFGADRQQRLLLAKILDKRSLCQLRDIPACSPFLSPEEQAAAADMLAQLPPAGAVFTGGYADAQRKVCLFLPSWMEEVPPAALCAVAASVPPMAKLGHRDYLGSLMGIGITREKLGDILLTQEGCQLIALTEVLPILLSQWASVGRYPVGLEELSLEQLSVSVPSGELRTDTVASLRLDAVFATGFSMARSRAAQLITAGRVQVNHRDCEKPDRMVQPGDVLGCRGMGKCVLRGVTGTSRKGRQIIELERFD